MDRLPASCPNCRTTYQLDPEMKGRRMRCPNAVCQFVFVVGAEEAAPFEPAVTDESRPSNLESKPADPPPAKQAAAKAKPRRANALVPPPVHRVKPVETFDEFSTLGDDAGIVGSTPDVQEVALGDWQAPPVRRRDATDDIPVSQPAAEPVACEPSPDVGKRKKQRRSRWIITMLALLLLLGVAAAAWIVLNRRAGIEAELAARAAKSFQNGDFAEAATQYRQLLQVFPASEQGKDYRFHAELSSVLDAVHVPHGDAGETVRTLERLGQFVRFHEGEPLFGKRQEDLWRAARVLTTKLLDQAEEQKDAQLLALANVAWETARAVRDPALAESPKDKRAVEERFTKLKELFADQQHRSEVITQLRQLPPSARSIQMARALIKKEKMETLPDATALLDDLIKDHRQRVTYTAVLNAPPPPSDPDDNSASLVFAPLIPVPAAQAMPMRTDKNEHPPLLAVAHGVLYALDVRDGRVLWAKRIGVDAQHLPLRVPATAISPEMALFISTDHNVVQAVELATGAAIWRYQLESPCVADPLLLGDKVLVPTVAGKIIELDVIAGRVRGYYQVDQRLTVAGVSQPGTDLVYFAADAFCVYVLDTVQCTCAAIMYTGHASGTLRTRPAVLSADPADRHLGHLLLMQADGVDAVKQRLFALPIKNADQPAIQPEPRIPGWCWFPLWQNGEYFAQATDAGVCHACGIRQPGNNDPVVFPLFQHALSGTTGKPRPGRALLVHADKENCWMLTQGRLQRLQQKFTETGPSLSERWPESLALGTPLHTAQLIHDDSQTTLFLVTQPEGSARILATALDAESGKFYWQRQLGVVAVADPILLGQKLLLPEEDGIDIIDSVTLSASAGMVHAECSRMPVSAAGTVHILKRGDGDEAFVVQLLKKALIVQQIDKLGKAAAPKSFVLSADAAETPALQIDHLVVPLANGVLERIALAGDEQTPGPNWRSGTADDDGRGFLLTVGKDEFLTSDGNRGLRLIHWPDAKSWDKKAERELPTRLAGPPALRRVLDRQFVVGEASGVVSVLDADGLHTLRTWQMPGRLTGGPFVHGSGIICIVEGNKLVFLDPSTREQPEYAFETEIVGEPQVLGEGVYVGTTAGQFQVMDMKTGRPRGNGYLLRANIAPTTSLLPLASDRLLTFLSDGTAMFVPVPEK